MSSGCQGELYESSSAQEPAACGVAIDVPLFVASSCAAPSQL